MEQDKPSKKLERTLSHPFCSLSSFCFIYWHTKSFEILNLTTNEIQYLIGEKEKENQLFNFETYLVEDYTGYAIKDMELNFEKEEYYYSEILEIIQNYREENQQFSLDRK